MTKEVDLKEEIQYWKKQCNCLKKDVRLLREELFLKDAFSKYEKFKEWVIAYHSDVWVVNGIFDSFEKEYDNMWEIMKR